MIDPQARALLTLIEERGLPAVHTQTPDEARRLYREDPDLQARFPDPFAAGPDSLRAHLLAARPDLA